MSEPTAEDGKEIWKLANALAPELDLNSAYKYLILCEFFPSSCVIAKNEEKVIGFITGFVSPERPDTVFVWQIGIDRAERGKGLGSKLLMKLVEQQDRSKISYVEATITPSNEASQILFHRLASNLNTKCHISLLFKKEMFPVQEDEEHEEELLFRIGPI